MIFGGGFILTHKLPGTIIRGGRLVRKLHVFFHHFRPGVPPRNRIRPLAHTPYGEGRGREKVRARAGVQAGREERQAGGRRGGAGGQEGRRQGWRAEGQEGWEEVSIDSRMEGWRERKARRGEWTAEGGATANQNEYPPSGSGGNNLINFRIFIFLLKISRL